MLHKHLRVFAAFLLLTGAPAWSDILDLRDPILPDSAETQRLGKFAKVDRNRRASLSDDELSGLLGPLNSFADARLGPSDLVGTLTIQADKLRGPTKVGSDGEFAVFGEPVLERGVQTLTIEGRTYELGAIAEVIDPKFGFRHITMQVFDLPESYARFSVGLNRQVVGTVQTPAGTYRILPSGDGWQLVYRIREGANGAEPLRHKRIAPVTSHEGARRLERRHVQLEKLADIGPEIVVTSEQGRTLSIRGGRLGILPRGKLRAADIARVLHKLSDLTYADSTLEVRTTEIRALRTGTRVEFEQVIKGIPVWRRNFIVVRHDGTIEELMTQLVDPARTQDLPFVSEGEALKHAADALEEKFKTRLAEIELITLPQLHYHVVPFQVDLVPRYQFAIDAGERGNWWVSVNAHTGESEVSDPRQFADVFGYHICRDPSGASAPHPTRCSDPGADIMWTNPLHGNPSCPYANPMGGYNPCVVGEAGAVQNALLNADRALKDIHQSGFASCCGSLGGPDRLVEVVYRTSGTTEPGAHYNTATESITTPVGDTSLESVENVWHEFGHHVLHKYNPNTTALYDQPNQKFASAFIESYGDVIEAGLAPLAYQNPQLYVGDPWIHGDGPNHPGPNRNLKDTQLTFAHLVSQSDHHERGRAISSFFYQVKTASNISDRRFMELLLEVGDGLYDVDGNGLDLIDLKNALHLAIRPGETALLNAMDSKFTAMYSPVDGIVPNPAAAPDPSAPPTPNPVTARFYRCRTNASGVRWSDWLVEWPASPGATHYLGFLKGLGSPFISDITDTTNLSAIAAVRGTAWASVEACNQNGCSSLSNQVQVYTKLPECPL